MIPTNVIDEWFDKAGTAIGLTFMAADQDIESKNRPDYPFGTYKVLTDAQRNARGYEKTYAPDPGGEKITETKRKRSNATISVNFVGKSGTPELVDFCNSFIDFVDDQEFKDAQNATYYDALFDPLDVYPIDPEGDDRTVFLDGVQYESKWGVDINFDYCRSVAKTIDALARIEIDNETASEQIIVDKTP
jgi:hypothetical protein